MADEEQIMDFNIANLQPHEQARLRVLADQPAAERTPEEHQEMMDLQKRSCRVRSANPRPSVN